MKWPSSSKNTEIFMLINNLAYSSLHILKSFLMRVSLKYPMVTFDLIFFSSAKEDWNSDSAGVIASNSCSGSAVDLCIIILLEVFIHCSYLFSAFI